MNCTIAPISAANADSFRECLDVVAREKRYLAQVQAPPVERIQSMVRDSVANDSVQFVALLGDRVIGWADIFPAWAAAVCHCGSLGMGVHPEFRERGIGEKLLRACLDKAPLKGITRVELEVRVDNRPAISLYEKVGFGHEATKKNAMRFDGIFYDSIQMSMVRDAAGTALPESRVRPDDHGSIALERPTFRVQRIDHVVLRVSDLARSVEFYRRLLGCAVERERPDLGLIHLRAGASLIDLVAIDGSLGKAGGVGPGAEGRNMDHFCLRIDPFNAEDVLAHLERHDVSRSSVASIRFGAEGDGPSIYFQDLDANTIELKGPPVVAG